MRIDRLAAMRSDTAISASLIKQARTRAGLSQAQVAERSGKAKVQIGRWETGVVAPSLDALPELLRAFDFDLPLTLEATSRSMTAGWSSSSSSRLGLGLSGCCAEVVKSGRVNDRARGGVAV